MSTPLPRAGAGRFRFRIFDQGGLVVDWCDSEEEDGAGAGTGGRHEYSPELEPPPSQFERGSRPSMQAMIESARQLYSARLKKKGPFL